MNPAAPGAFAVAYLRIGREEQAGLFEKQRAAIEAWAAKHGVTIVSWHEEIGSAGRPLAERGVLREAILAAREHEPIAFLLVDAWDRVARGQKAMVEIHDFLGIVEFRSTDGGTLLPNVPLTRRQQYRLQKDLIAARQKNDRDLQRDLIAARQKTANETRKP